MKSQRTHEQAWMDASTRMCVEAHKLLLQVKRTLRAHDNMTHASHKCLGEAMSSKQKDNPFGLLMTAMGMGMELEGSLREAAYRDGVAHLHLSQAVDLLTDLGCLQEPAGQMERLEALRMAILDNEGEDYQKQLNAAMVAVAEVDQKEQYDDGTDDDESDGGS